MLDTIEFPKHFNEDDLERETLKLDLNAQPLPRYSHHFEVKNKLDQIKGSREMFFKNCTPNIQEVETDWGSICVKPNKFAKFEPMNT